jgi:hypothetical protein
MMIIIMSMMSIMIIMMMIMIMMMDRRKIDGADETDLRDGRRAQCAGARAGPKTRFRSPFYSL